MTCLLAPWTGILQWNAIDLACRWRQEEGIWLYDALALVGFGTWLRVCRIQYEFLKLEKERDNLAPAGQELLREVTENLMTFGCL
jgi:hypothetical protein